MIKNWPVAFDLPSAFDPITVRSPATKMSAPAPAPAPAPPAPIILVRCGCKTKAVIPTQCSIVSKHVRDGVHVCHIHAISGDFMESPSMDRVKRTPPTDEIRCTSLTTKGTRCALRRKFGDKCHIHHQ